MVLGGTAVAFTAARDPTSIPTTPLGSQRAF
jgi:hypothetical protein